MQEGGEDALWTGVWAILKNPRADYYKRRNALIALLRAEVDPRMIAELVREAAWPEEKKRKALENTLPTLNGGTKVPLEIRSADPYDLVDARSCSNFVDFCTKVALVREGEREPFRKSIFEW